ncbi:MAG TPA: trigger factor, partial [Gammaproteobacteria bacterium]|nr:trigger factor [Gammaproteobacteria bacterium]
MEVSVENTGSLERRLTVSVPEAQINEQCRTKMAELAKDVKLKGFRPGKIPPHILQQRFGKAVRAEVVGDIIQKSLENALKEKNLLPAGMPTIEQIQDESGKSLEYTAKFEIFPEIKLGDLSEVEVEKKKVDITDEDIQKTITKMCENLGTWESVTRASKMGDKLIIDLERRWTTQEDELQSYVKIDFSLDEKKSLPDLVNQLLDKNIDDEIDCTITYPDTWHDEKIRGREATFKVKIHEILEKKPLTVEALGEKLNLDKEDPNILKEKIKERMEKEASKVIQDELKEKVLEILLEKNPIEKPKTLIEQEKKALKEEIALS